MRKDVGRVDPLSWIHRRRVAHEHIPLSPKQGANSRYRCVSSPLHRFNYTDTREKLEAYHLHGWYKVYPNDKHTGLLPPYA